MDAQLPPKKKAAFGKRLSSGLKKLTLSHSASSSPRSASDASSISSEHAYSARSMPDAPGGPSHLAALLSPGGGSAAALPAAIAKSPKPKGSSGRAYEIKASSGRSQARAPGSAPRTKATRRNPRSRDETLRALLAAAPRVLGALMSVTALIGASALPPAQEAAAPAPAPKRGLFGLTFKLNLGNVTLVPYTFASLRQWGLLAPIRKQQ